MAACRMACIISSASSPLEKKEKKRSGAGSGRYNNPNVDEEMGLSIPDGRNPAWFYPRGL